MTVLHVEVKMRYTLIMVSKWDSSCLNTKLEVVCEGTNLSQSKTGRWYGFTSLTFLTILKTWPTDLCDENQWQRNKCVTHDLRFGIHSPCVLKKSSRQKATNSQYIQRAWIYSVLNWSFIVSKQEIALLCTKCKATLTHLEPHCNAVHKCKSSSTSTL
jgi:hypothetical protein